VPANSVIGLDIGGTKILAGVVDRDGVVGERRERPTPSTSQDHLLRALTETVDELLAVNPAVGAVGLGVASRVDQRTGTAVTSTNVPLTGVPLRDAMKARFGLPVGLDNDANAAAIGEWAFGAGRGTSHLVMVTLGTGVGGGLVLDGRPYRGARGLGAELGHIVVQHDGPPCRGTCTGRGHLEALVSGGAADDVARMLFGPRSDARELVARAREGEPRAAAATREMGRALGSALATLVNTFEPEVLVLGGGFGAAADLLLPPALEVLGRDGLAPARDDVRVEAAVLGVDAGFVGAALVAFEALDGAADGG
jgi:glucokinase